MCTQIFEQKALCQQDPDQDEEEDILEDQSEMDSVVISSAGDLVAAIANALGNDFAQGFGTFYPLISKYYVSCGSDITLRSYLTYSFQKKGRSLSDRSSAIGCLAEIIGGMKGAVTQFTEPLLELFYLALGDDEAEVQSNAAFASGLLVEHSEIDLSAQYLPLLGALRPLFSVASGAPGPRLNARDNAAGAVGRMIVKNAAAVPLDQVLPIFVNALPLKNDPLENRPVFRAIFHLFRTNSQSLAPYLQQLLQVFTYVLDPSREDDIGEETRGELLHLVSALNAENPTAVQNAGLDVFVR
jgi:importin-4